MGTSGVRRRLGVVAAVLVVGAVALGGSAGARAASSTGDVYVIHGLVGTDADVFIDGGNVAATVTPKTVIGPLKLAAGSHVVTFKSGSTTLVNAQFTVKAGSSTDVVAHMTADAKSLKVVTVFPNDLTPVAPGKLRLVVSHVAVAPPADIRDEGKPLFRNVANGESLSVVMPAMTCVIDIVPTATTGPAILAPVTIKLMAGTLTRIFAVGDASAGTTDAVVQVIPISVTGSKAPTKVQTGDGGQAADSFVGSGPGAGTMLGLALVLALVAWAAIARGAANAERVIGSRHAR